MSDFYRAAKNQSLALTTVAVSANLESSTYVRYYRIVADRRFHVKIDSTGEDATTSDFFIPAECVENFQVSPGQDISFLKAAGETDGTLWICEQ